MHERIVELIIYFVTELRSQKSLKDIDLTALSHGGYSPQEISTAFSWVHDRLSSGKPTQLTSAIARQSFRVLNEAERMVIEQEALGYLMQVHQLGLVSNEDVEAVIDRCMANSSDTVDLQEIKYYISAKMFEHEVHKNVHARIINDSPDSIH